MAHRCWKGIKRFITHIMRLSRESREGFKAYLKMSWENRKGPLTWGSLVLRKWDSSGGSLHGAMFSWFDLPISTERTSGSLPSLPRCGAEEVKLESYQQSNIKRVLPFSTPEMRAPPLPRAALPFPVGQGSSSQLQLRQQNYPSSPHPRKTARQSNMSPAWLPKKKKLFRKLWVKKRPCYLNTFQNIKAYA